MMSITPTQDRIFVSRKKTDEVTEGGLILVHATDQSNDMGVVLAVGPGRDYPDGSTIPLEVKPGDKVLFSAHAGQTTVIDGEEILVMREDDVFAIFS